MDTLLSMKVFVRVAQRSGFAAAARDLRISPAAVTKHIAALESRMGARLLDRTTRRVTLTEAGRLYLERCMECLQAFEDADASMSELTQRPRGLLRLSAPVDMQHHLPPVVARFMAMHPEVLVDLQLSNRPVDLVEEGIDLALRVAPALDGRYVARPLARVHVGIFAAPKYLEKYGHPRGPGDLCKHRSLVFLEPRPRDEWILERNGRRVHVKLKAALLSNIGEALCVAATEGAGLVTAPSFVTRADQDAGRIVPVLPQWTVLPELHLFAIYPHRRFVAAKVRAFVDMLHQHFGDGSADPWWREE